MWPLGWPLLWWCTHTLHVLALPDGVNLTSLRASPRFALMLTDHEGLHIPPQLDGKMTA